MDIVNAKKCTEDWKTTPTTAEENEQEKKEKVDSVVETIINL